MKLLKPHKVSKYLTLVEAIEWIAYRSYPIEHDADDEGGSRFKEDFNYKRVFKEEYNTETDKEIQIFIEEQRVKGQFYPFPIESVTYQELLNKKRKEIDLLEYGYLSQIENAKHVFFACLTEGRLSAYGALCAKMKEGFSPLQWRSDDAWEEIDYFEKPIQEIPSSGWKFEGITWENAKIISADEKYLLVHVRFDEIIKIHKEKEPEYITIENRNGCLLYNDVVSEPEQEVDIKRLGRKPAVDWDVVHARIAEDILRSKGKLSKQDSYAQDIRSWITKEFGLDVGISTIKGKLKPYYSRFQKE